MPTRYFCVLALFLAAAIPFTATAKPVGWESMPAILARIKAPEFPSRDFEITKYGAVAGGADCTDAIKQAIAACNKAGGGRVVVPAGVWHTGAVHLLSNVNLHISEGATLKFFPDQTKYLPNVLTRIGGIECFNYSPLIYAFEQENIALTGKGIIDGGASWEKGGWWEWTKRGKLAKEGQASGDRIMEMEEKQIPVAQRIFGEGHYHRPNFVQPFRCKNVLIEGVTIHNSPNWEIHPVYCTNVTVRGLTIDTHGPNNDGIDPDSCRDVLIENCSIDTGDDCIAIKSGINDDGRRVGLPSENLIIRNCVMKDGHGGVVLGSEVAGSVRNVFVENCKMDSPHLDRALRFKSNARRGGVLENVFLRNIEIGRVAEAIVTVDFLYAEGAKGPHKPVVRNVRLENVTSKSSPRVLYVIGFPGAIVDDVEFVNCTFRGVETAEVVMNSANFSFRNTTIEPAKLPKALNSPKVEPAKE
ncbi:MAG: glycoside hydrolase family 28 protein [Nibricoccus sp.]